MPHRRPFLLSQATALLLSAATAVVPFAMGLQASPPAATALAATEMAGMHHEGMREHHGSSSPLDMYRCCDLCAVACSSTATLPTVVALAVVTVHFYPAPRPDHTGTPFAGSSALRLPFAQGPPSLLV
jgi:hypothetical protein